MLLASDIAARGLDIPGVDYVFNLDLPEDPQVYLHRAGRTGRAGHKGTVVSILAKHELVFIKEIQKTLSIQIASMEYSGGRIMDYRPRNHPQSSPSRPAKGRKPLTEKDHQHESNSNRKPGQKLRRPDSV
ncbi:helicase-related protein [Acetonema longum]|uniref:DEAD/DEAH box helicase domain-containing protein n=1 Tax=Acetonema longum DSM 6540 TaxID=1009370 RepID=F7NGY6_9FIRM|nr:helicase-related protein [Acetonema longum]EGO64717.1 DEAD/DEAH box helicase domain-containing protein [Acetonema longum DSM 6540]